MINQTFVHCSGIGPKTEQKLKDIGFNTWQDCINNASGLPFQEKKREEFVDQLICSQKALDDSDIEYLVSALPSKEHWRLLGTYFDKTTFFDIETTGLSSYDSLITVIVAFKDNQLYTFLFQENLDDFLNLVEESELLVAFNGNSFDIPFIENAFNIPEIGCPFIDLRWICYHEGYKGGLKSIEKEFYIKRPQNIESIDGFEAVSLFFDWQNGDTQAKEKLIKYCQADVLASYLVAQQLTVDMGFRLNFKSQENLFELLK